MDIAKTYAGIEKLLAQGERLENILINEDNEEWGESGACTRAQAEELIAEWAAQGQEADINDLTSAADWMEKNPR